jgi:hypothetical protein
MHNTKSNLEPKSKFLVPPSTFSPNKTSMFHDFYMKKTTPRDI